MIVLVVEQCVNCPDLFLFTATTTVFSMFSAASLFNDSFFVFCFLILFISLVECIWLMTVEKVQWWENKNQKGMFTLAT